MSFIDRLAATLTPDASDEARKESRAAFERQAASEPLLRIIVDQHKEIEAAFAKAHAARDSQAATAAVEELAHLLTGHSMAEEAVIYPDIASHDSKTHAGMAYEEHAMAKMQLARLRDLDHNNAEWREVLEHLEGAVQQHVHQEEGTWLPALAANLPAGRKDVLATRFLDEYRRYMEGEAHRPTMQQPGSSTFA